MRGSFDRIFCFYILVALAEEVSARETSQPNAVSAVDRISETMENREAAWEERQSDRVEGLLGKVQKRIARVSGKAGNENAVSFLESGRDGEGNADRDTFFFGSGPSNIENSSKPEKKSDEKTGETKAVGSLDEARAARKWFIPGAGAGHRNISPIKKKR